ncbi:hypothetical protein CIL05_01180 [Virgibacillus profundi]|uniref:AlgX/AlgJ SGNH hydrolase-like domain-containing protein n=1 Tax=Virgibacillus profundi TaxID=2024555 RepID=A0A2A2IJ58_9BACI|nr:DHHW family protein [Virgibacillus profundi]PAV31294.1 hypothetical protein CIL05_01180 [Virgibacillus profundi]PXY55479.1 hypothetical protein CIT14_01185 [Virgibacillus profundi]
MNKFGDVLLSVLFILFIFSIGIYLLIMPDKEVSDIENRNLAQKPELTLSDFTSGEYMLGFEAYITDQFPGRDKWLKTYVNYQMLMDKTYIQDYYITEENWIMPKPQSNFPKKDIDIAAENIKNFGDYLADKDIEFYYFSVPHKVSVLPFLYPDYITAGNYKEKTDYLMSQIGSESVIKVDFTKLFLDEFSNEDLKKMYFKTDHHWNMNGAFQVYKTIVDTFSNHSDTFISREVNKDHYERRCFPSNLFDGSYNKQLYRLIDTSGENLCTLLSDSFQKYEVIIEGKRIEPYELYGSAFKDTKSDLIAYNDLFTRDLREINITNPKKKDENNKLLIIKDSYTNPIIYHLAEGFYKTTIYDPRHNKDRTVVEFIEENNFDMIAVIYNSTQIRGENFNFGDVHK